MEMIKDQSDRATAGWTGFMGTPTTKETAQKAVDLIPKKWFYKEVILFLSLPPSLHPSPLKNTSLKISFNSDQEEDATTYVNRRGPCTY